MPDTPDRRRGSSSSDRDRSGRPRRPAQDDDALTFDTRRGGSQRGAPRGGSGARSSSAAGSPGRRDPRTAGSGRGIPPAGSGPRPRSGDAQAIPQGTRSPGQAPRGPEGGTRVMPARGASERPRGATSAAADNRGRPTGGRRGAGTGSGNGPGGRRRPRTSGRIRARRIGAGVLVVVLLWVVAEIWAVSSSWASVNRVAATPTAERAPDGAGRNILMVGSDSRAGMSKAERDKLGTGQAAGARTDSIMLLHLGSGDPTLLSIPRDSYVEIPGKGMNKINAAYAIGGPKLLARTVEHSTGLRVDGFMEIGFGGFADVVDAVDGVRICLKAPMKDEKAHIDLPKGCQVLDGKNALGYVRARYSDPEGDLGRVKRQRQFLGALLEKMATPANVLLPWRLHSLGTAAGSALTIGKDDSMYGTARAFLGLRDVAQGNGNSVTVPVANPNLSTPAGSAVQWDEQKSATLFTELKNDTPLTIDPTDG